MTPDDHPDPQIRRSVRPTRPAGTGIRHKILEAARFLFAQKGYSGANINQIVVQAGTTKPMIYYHFGSKEGLFTAVLEEVYADMREIEMSLKLGGLPAMDAIRHLVGATFDYHAAHPDWIRLISIANIHDGKHILASPTIAARNSAVVDILRDLLIRGAREGVFRAGLDPLHLHLLINSVCFYRISNRHTWRIIFSRDLHAPDDAALQRTMLIEAVSQYLRPDAVSRE